MVLVGSPRGLLQPSLTETISVLVLHCQFQLQITGSTDLDEKQEIWFLLTRHIVDKQRTAEFISLNVSEFEGQPSEYDQVRSASTTDPKASAFFAFQGAWADGNFGFRVFSRATPTAS